VVLAAGPDGPDQRSQLPSRTIPWWEVGTRRNSWPLRNDRPCGRAAGRMKGFRLVHAQPFGKFAGNERHRSLEVGNAPADHDHLLHSGQRHVSFGRDSRHQRPVSRPLCRRRIRWQAGDWQPWKVVLAGRRQTKKTCWQSVTRASRPTDAAGTVFLVVRRRHRLELLISRWAVHTEPVTRGRTARK